MGNKTGLITPFLMLLAGAISAIIMYVRGFDLTTMLWGLLIVLIIFYILGDIARYIYASIRPRIIPTRDLDKMVIQAKKNSDLTGSVVAFAGEDQEDAEMDMDADGLMSEDTYSEDEAYDAFEDGYSDEEMEEFTDEMGFDEEMEE